MNGHEISKAFYGFQGDTELNEMVVIAGIGSARPWHTPRIRRSRWSIRDIQGHLEEGV